ncbi:MAG: ATP-binding protein [Cyanobacteria bacterium P01_E01_bin.42]
MTLDLQRFFNATDPGKTLFSEKNEEDQKYYIDFSSVRGGQIIEELRDNIVLWSPNKATCQLFTGHIGCGKSTELLRLKAQLEQENFHVVYFESSQDLEMGDVDVSDILLAIARQVSSSLEQMNLDRPRELAHILQEAARLLQTEIDFSAEVKTPIAKVGADSQGKFSLDVGIAKITAKAKASPTLRSKLRGYLEPLTNGLLDAINQELLEPGIEQLKKHGKKGLVAIVDNLDQISSSPKAWKRPQHEYLFVDRGEQLRELHCHVVYTMPLSLRFSNDFENLTQRFRNDPKVLPMVPIKSRDGKENEEGMQLLRQMVLARAFPDLDANQRGDRISEVFDDMETLNHLCRISGGHVRNLLRLLNDSIKKEKGLPISRKSLQDVIQGYSNERRLAIDDSERELLHQVAKEKKVLGDRNYQILIRSMFVYEYRDDRGSWFDVNPIVAEE